MQRGKNVNSFLFERNNYERLRVKYDGQAISGERDEERDDRRAAFRLEGEVR